MTRTFISVGSWLWLLLAAAACHSGSLVGVDVSLSFSSPDQPAAVQRLDAGLVQIAFGQVAVDSTKSLTLSVDSISGSAVTLGTLTQVQPDPEFSLPFAAGTVVQPSPATQVTVSFAPTSLGNKTAVYSLAYTPPAGAAVTIELTGQGVPSGLTVTPNPVDFGNVELNQVQPVPLTIANNTDSSANLSLSALGGAQPNQFSLGPLSSTTLAPGASATLNAMFGPLVTGAASASFAITGAFSTGTSRATTVSLTGTGVQSWLQVSSPLDFGYVSPSHTLVKSAVLTNAGSFTTLHLIAPAPAVASGSQVFSLAPPQPALPLALAPGQSAQIPVAFTPPNLGRFPGTLSLATDDPGSPAPVIQLEGNGGGPQILCVSPLSFGPVPIDFAVSQQTLCLNIGTDIPGDPDAGLQIDQSSLAIDNQAFTARLTLPDGGPAGPGFSVSLSPGESAAIEVTFRPEDAGTSVGRLVVPSNDASDADAGVLLRGQGIVPGLCSVSLVPMELSFGEVPSGDTGLLPFQIINTGQNLCVLTGITVAPQSDPAFSLPGGNLAPQLLSFPGDSDNPAARPASLTVDVQFAPSTSEAAATGAVDVDIANAMPANQTVSLVGSSAAACLIIEPTSYDFGLVGFSPSTHQICVPDEKTFVAQNACTVPVTINAIDISSGVAPTPQFVLLSYPQLPTVIAPGGFADFTVAFTPSEVGSVLGSVSVSTSEFSSAPFLLMLKGDAEKTGSRTDTFVAAAPNKQVDILWVLDEDDDLSAVTNLANAVPELTNTLESAQIDYQMAVTSTDTCDGGSSDQGSFEPCDHCLSSAAGSPTFITPATPQPATSLVDLLSLFDRPPQLGLCEDVNGDEHFFDTLADAFSPSLLGGHNSGFIRNGANLAVVIVNGDSEDDAHGSQTTGPYLTSLAEVTALMQSFKPDPTMVSVSFVGNGGGGLAEATPQMAALVTATGGAEIDTGLEDLATALIASAPFGGAGVWAFHLTSIPAGQIQVNVDGMTTPGWSYDAVLNDIVFIGSPPAPGSTITVTYNLGCP